MAEWHPTNRKGLDVRHAKRCRAREGKRCSCVPSYRGKRRSPLTREPEYSRTSKIRSTIVTWLEGGQKATEAVQERRAAGPTFGELARRRREGVTDGSIAKRRGRGRYSPTTWRRYGHSLDYSLQLIAALDPDDGLPYAIAFYGGERRSELDRLEWPDVDLDAQLIHVRASKSEAGTNRRAPFAAPLSPMLKQAFLRQGRASTGRVLGRVGILSSRLAERADRAWAAHDRPLQRVTLHECRHTYASYLMAAGYTLREIMEYLGHSSLAATERYVKLLPQPQERSPADRLNDYVARAAGRAGW